MIAKVCDICGKVETPERRDFHTFTHDWGCFKRVKDFHICSECMNLIKELRAKQKVTSEWIPVSERLPEYDEIVLVTANGKHNNITFEHAIELAVYAKDKVYAEDKGWILEAYPDWLEPNVTAWMPLPEPFVTDTNVGNKKGAGR